LYRINEPKKYQEKVVDNLTNVRYTPITTTDNALLQIKSRCPTWTPQEKRGGVMTTEKKDFLKIANELIEKLHDHGCSVAEAEHALSVTQQVLKATTPVPRPGKIPYHLSHTIKDEWH